MMGMRIQVILANVKGKKGTGKRQNTGKTRQRQSKGKAKAKAFGTVCVIDAYGTRSPRTKAPLPTIVSSA